MEKDHSREWIKITTNYTKNPKEKIVCPVCNDEILTVTPVGKEKKITDIYFQCGKCSAHNIMSIAASYQEKMYDMIYHKDTNT